MASKHEKWFGVNKSVSRAAMRFEERGKPAFFSLPGFFFLF